MRRIGSRSLADYPAPIVRIECPRCGRAGCYALARLIERFSEAAVLPEMFSWSWPPASGARTYKRADRNPSPPALWDRPVAIRAQLAGLQQSSYSPGSAQCSSSFALWLMVDRMTRWHALTQTIAHRPDTIIRCPVWIAHHPLPVACGPLPVAPIVLPSGSWLTAAQLPDIPLHSTVRR